MKAVFVFTPSESRRLLAKAVAQMDEVRVAMEKAYVVIVGGVTNGMIAQEIAGLDVDPQSFTAGISTNGMLCVTCAEERDDRIPVVLHKGELVKKTVPEVFDDFHLETVLIKGGNAVDTEGNVGVITSGFDGGTIAATIGTITSTGMTYIFAVGLEKLVPSVREAASWAGSKTMDYTMGPNFGMYCLSNGIVVTEIEALRILAGVEAKHIASGGVGGSEGAVVIAVQGPEADVKKAIAAAESVKGEPAIAPMKGACDACPYDRCVFYGKKEDKLPEWMDKGKA